MIHSRYTGGRCWRSSWRMSTIHYLWAVIARVDQSGERQREGVGVSLLYPSRLSIRMNYTTRVDIWDEFSRAVCLCCLQLWTCIYTYNTIVSAHDYDNNHTCCRIDVCCVSSSVHWIGMYDRDRRPGLISVLCCSASSLMNTFKRMNVSHIKHLQTYNTDINAREWSSEPPNQINDRFYWMSPGPLRKQIYLLRFYRRYAKSHCSMIYEFIGHDFMHCGFF